jgi:hypothetical protein
VRAGLDLGQVAKKGKTPARASTELIGVQSLKPSDKLKLSAMSSVFIKIYGQYLGPRCRLPFDPHFNRG